MLILYLIIALNIIGFIIMGYDKGLAKLNSQRVSERTLFIIAFIGGAMGVYIGMKVFHHKTKHSSFIYGIPILIAVNLIMTVVLYKYGYTLL